MIWFCGRNLLTWRTLDGSRCDWIYFTLSQNCCLNFSCVLMCFFFFIVKPTFKTFKSEPTSGILGKSLKITCKAEGVPELNYIIRHNGSILAGVTDGMKTINQVQYSDAGSYTCTANNILGNSTRSLHLSVEGEICCIFYLLRWYILTHARVQLHVKRMYSNIPNLPCLILNLIYPCVNTKQIIKKLMQ